MDSPEEKTPSAGKTPRRRLWLRVLACALLPVGFLLYVRAGYRQWLKEECTHNMKQLGLVCRAYASDHDGYFPGRWSDMKKEEYYVSYVGTMRCPATDHELGSLATVDSWADYRLLPGLTEKSPKTQILISERLSNHNDSGAHMLFVDGHVEWWPAEKVRGQ